MISVSRLYCGVRDASDALRYGSAPGAVRARRARRPIVVWNATRSCNLSCAHCYSASGAAPAPDELTGDQARRFIDQLAAYGCPVLLFSGGEPLLRRDVPDLAAYAVQRGLRVVVSSNGTLLDDDLAWQLKEAGVAYVGISLDGLARTHDQFRGKPGAFAAALEGIRAAQREELKVGIRYTMLQSNADDIPGIFDLLESEQIPRACFYHLVYTGRGAELADEDLDHARTRAMIDYIIDRAADLKARGTPREILTVDNHADGPFIYLRQCREGSPRADETLDLLRRTGGNGAGETISCVGWDGTVYPDQFWREHPLGNVLERSFGEIWEDTAQPLMASLKNKAAHVTGRCATCRFLDVCGGNFRARAEAATGELWGVDPACYLTDAEIAR